MSEHIATLYVLSYDELIDLPEVKLYCPYWDPHAAEQNVSGPVREIREIRALHPNRPILVFSCIRFFSFLHRRLVALQDQGMQVVLVCLLRDVSNATDVAEMRDACSYVYCADGQILDYLQVIRAAEADYVHVFANAGSSKIPLLAARAAGQGYVAEYNDLLTTMYDLRELSCLLGEEEASVEWLCERRLLRDSSGLVFKNDEEAIHDLRTVHGLGELPALKFWSYPSLARYRPCAEERPLQIAMIGGTSPRDNHTNVATWQIFDVIAKLTRQGFDVHFYNAYDSGGTDAFEAFWAKDREDKRFNYHAAIHPAEVTDSIAQFDLGWLVWDFCDYKPNMQAIYTCMSARLLDYLDAGLPTILSREFRSMGRIVEGEDLGILVAADEIDSLGLRLSRQIVERQRKAVHTYAKRILMKNQIHRLVDFYADRLGQP
jgi:hypothetical protein